MENLKIQIKWPRGTAYMLNEAMYQDLKIYPSIITDKTHHESKPKTPISKWPGIP